MLKLPRLAPNLGSSCLNLPSRACCCAQLHSPLLMDTIHTLVFYLCQDQCFIYLYIASHQLWRRLMPSNHITLCPFWFLSPSPWYSLKTLSSGSVFLSNPNPNKILGVFNDSSYSPVQEAGQVQTGVLPTAPQVSVSPWLDSVEILSSKNSCWCIIPTRTNFGCFGLHSKTVKCSTFYMKWVGFSIKHCCSLFSNLGSPYPQQQNSWALSQIQFKAPNNFPLVGNLTIDLDPQKLFESLDSLIFLPIKPFLFLLLSYIVLILQHFCPSGFHLVALVET